ncbi:MAG TPA: ribosome biogenesis GTPase Der [Planctomycetaceae bacterium]|nr:ribosome biogenesis GTPase Der [Planctomycetaceae bacterium]
MSVPKVVIVGRPNVGKSSLLNWLARRMVSVVDPTAGVTRDRVTSLMHEGGRSFELVDTGGMGIEDIDNLTADIERQIQIAVGEADLLLFVVDAQAGFAPLDRHVADRLRRIDAPKLLVVNKADNPQLEAAAPEFFRLMDVPVVLTSVKGNRNRQELIDAVLAHLPPPTATSEAEEAAASAAPEMKLAIVGRRNVGKSTFINALAEEERVIVSEVPGTTRDSVDVRFEVDGKPFVAIDTPGVRKRKSLASDVEFYGLVRAQKSIRRADVVLMFFDATDTISRVDKQLVEDIYEHHKPCIFVVNKWDRGLAEDMTSESWGEYLIREFPTMRHVPVALVTAKEGRNVRQLVNLAQSLFKQARLRVATAELNRVLHAAVERNPPPSRRNRRPKVYFATQVAVQPPTIVIKCNDPVLFDDSWKRYLLTAFRESLPFEEVPIKLYFRSRVRDEEATETPASKT